MHLKQLRLLSVGWRWQQQPRELDFGVLARIVELRIVGWPRVGATSLCAASAG